MQFLFVDSNLFLQCRPLKELDWDSLVGRDEVTLLVPSAVLAELDKHKSDGNNRRAQKARGAIQFLNSILEAPDDTVVIRETPVKIIAKFAPGVSGDVNTSNDDSILFEVDQMTRTHGNQVVGLVTDDTNLKVKAKRKGLRFLPIPDNWLLAPEPDERDKRVKKLEEDVALLKRQTPIIEITIDGCQEIELVVPSYEPLPQDAVDRLMNAMIEKFPMKTNFSLSSYEKLQNAARLNLFSSHPPADWEIEKYQKEEYPKWEQELHRGLKHLHTRLRFREATANVRLLVANNGTVSGEHVHIAITASPGLQNFNRGYHDTMVKLQLALPEAPSAPQTRESALTGLINSQALKGLGMPIRQEKPSPPGRDKFYRKAGKDIDAEWVWKCENMRHGGSPEEFIFRIGMKAQSQPSGGLMSIKVSAENLPTAAEKKFPIKITNKPADTERAANEWLGLNCQ